MAEILSCGAITFDEISAENMSCGAGPSQLWTSVVLVTILGSGSIAATYLQISQVRWIDGLLHKVNHRPAPNFRSFLASMFGTIFGTTANQLAHSSHSSGQSIGLIDCPQIDSGQSVGLRFGSVLTRCFGSEQNIANDWQCTGVGA